ncbi:MAG: hypothetical protein ACTHK7_15885 [Aureliella sp.]
MIPQFSILAATGRWRAAGLVLAAWALSFAPAAPQAAAQATMTIDVVDEKTGEPIPCRVELRDAKGRPLKTRGALVHMPWNVVDGSFFFKGRQGNYEFRITHGPQYAGSNGGFTLDRDGDGTDTVRLPRHANLAEEGWLAGDLLSAIAADAAARWLPAEDLQMAAVLQRPPLAPVPQGEQPDAKPSEAQPHTEKLPEERWCDVGSYYDDRPGSGLVLHHWRPPAPVPASVPSTRLLVMAKREAAKHAEIARLWARDTPIWLASGRIDSIQVLSEHATHDGRTDIKLSDMYHPDRERFQGKRGPGRLVEDLYWQVLEAGLRIPPSAGSGVGRSSSPLGYNRVYVSQPSTAHSPESWWQALRAGRSFITNGPLLRATVNGELPGHVFASRSGQKLTLDVALTLTVADPVEYVDVVFNGEAIYHARLDEYAKQGGKIPPLEITESGWVIVRVVTQLDETYRLAMTAPYYIEFDGQRRISRKACELFAKWLETSSAQLEGSDRQAAEPYITAARKFWRERIERATVEGE